MKIFFLPFFTKALGQLIVELPWSINVNQYFFSEKEICALLLHRPFGNITPDPANMIQSDATSQQ